MPVKRTKGKARSAISGKYISKPAAKRNPKTSVVEHDVLGTHIWRFY